MVEDVHQDVIILNQRIYLFQIFYFLFGECRDI